MKFFLSLALVAIVPATLVHSAILGYDRRESPSGRHIDIHNLSGRRFDVLWVNRNVHPVTYHTNSENGEGYPFGADAGISSYIGHEFKIQEMPSQKTGKCLYDECRTAMIQVTDNQRQQFTVNKDFEVKYEDDKTVAEDEAARVLEACRSKIMESMDSMDALQMIDAMAECVELGVNATVAKHQEEIDFQARVRSDMAHTLVPFACGDADYESTYEVVNRTWHFQDPKGRGFKPYQLQVFHERPGSLILQIPNFVSGSECEALTYFLTSDNEKVRLDAIDDKTKQGSEVADLADKLTGLMETVLNWKGLDLKQQKALYGQELFDIIIDEEGVSVLPKCTKEELEALPAGELPSTCRLPGAQQVQVDTHKVLIDQPGHVADVLLFCNPSEEQQLGGVHFPNAAVHINPKPNLLVLVAHRAVEDDTMESYTTEYHFCPNHSILKHSFFTQVDETSTNKGTTSGTSGDVKDEL